MDSRRELEALRECIRALEQALEAARGQSTEMLQRLEALTNCSACEIHTDVPFTLNIGEALQIPDTPCYSIPLLIRNQTDKLLNCAVLVSSPVGGVQDVREIGELSPGQAVRLYYEVSTVEDLLFEAVMRTPPVAFHRPNRTPITTTVSYLESDKALVRMQRLEKTFSTFTFTCKFTADPVTVAFPGDTDEVYLFLPLSPEKRGKGLHEEVWTVQAADCSWQVTLVYHVYEK